MNLALTWTGIHECGFKNDFIYLFHHSFIYIYMREREILFTDAEADIILNYNTISSLIHFCDSLLF